MMMRYLCKVLVIIKFLMIAIAMTQHYQFKPAENFNEIGRFNRTVIRGIGLLAFSSEVFSAPPARTINRSQTTTGAEEDNVIVPWGSEVNHHEIIASTPATTSAAVAARKISAVVAASSSTERRTPASRFGTMGSTLSKFARCLIGGELFDGGTVNNSQPKQGTVRMSRKIADADSWPQFLFCTRTVKLIRLNPTRAKHCRMYASAVR
ncbi:MAG: hypothetical protein U1F42_04330 [Candidatus Competibacteraceae bacterium]